MSNSQNNGHLHKDAPEELKPIRRSRFVRNGNNPPPIRPRKRDLEILNALREYRFLTAFQIKALFFTSIHKARKRLFLLWQNKYLERAFLPPVMGEGAPFAIYALGSQGVRLLVSHAGFDREAIGQTIPKSRASYLFIEHTLRRNDFRIALTLACREKDELSLTFWKQDKSIKVWVTMANGKIGHSGKVAIFPDGFFGIRHNSREFYYFLEIDRGTVDGKRMLSRFKAYRELWLSRLCLKKYGIPNFRVLTVTTSRPRMGNLIRTAMRASEGGLGSNLFLFSTFERYNLDKSQSILEPIWNSWDPRETERICLLGRPA
jgi:hypothetical protein